MTELKIDEIKRVLANRYPYLMIDRVTEIVPGQYAKGYKNLTANEWFFPVHFPEEPMMPGMIQMEALFQMLSLTVLMLPDYEGRSVKGIYANKIRLKKHVTPGSTLLIVAELDSIEDGVGCGRAKGFIKDELACEGEFRFKIV